MNEVAGAEIASALVRLEKIGDNLFRNCYNQDNQLGMMFGGQLLTQGLAAATQTAPPWSIHNCSASFPNPGSSRQPVEYWVETLRDGKRFANRRVTARQGDRQILEMQCSFHRTGSGPEHQTTPIPDVPPPESLLPEPDFVRANTHRIPALAVTALTLPFPVELRVVDPEEVYFGDGGHGRQYWFRFPSADRVTGETDHACLLAFLSDYRLGAAALAPHLSPLEVERMIVATLNHSLWYHRPARTDDWLLFVTDSPWAGQGRGLTRGSIFNREGDLVASVAQELMVGIRQHSENKH